MLEVPRVLSPPTEAFLLQCGNAVIRGPGRVLLNWEVMQEITLDDCKTCQGCKLLKMSSRSVSP